MGRFAIAEPALQNLRGDLMVRVLPSERLLPDGQNAHAGAPLPEAKAELPPVIRRAEVVAFALVALLIICVVAVLWAAKAFFLPVAPCCRLSPVFWSATGFPAHSARS
jgi:hypothetical protein